jgi:DNA-binding NarL/FixJ family response regulator
MAREARALDSRRMTANVGALTLFAPQEDPPRRLTLLQGSDPATGTIRVAVADGQRLVRAGVRLLLEREPGIEVIGEAGTGEEAIDLVRRTRPDVTLVDVHLPGLDFVEATRRMLAEPGVAVILLTASEPDHRLFAALGAGAGGLLRKDTEPDELVRAVRLLGRGGRLRPGTRIRKQPSREEYRMQTPKVIEIRRGCAHGPTVGPANAAAGQR